MRRLVVYNLFAQSETDDVVNVWKRQRRFCRVGGYWNVGMKGVRTMGMLAFKDSASPAIPLRTYDYLHFVVL